MSKKLLVILLTAVLLLPALAWAAEELIYIGSSTIGMGIMEEGAAKTFESKTKIKFKSIESIGSGKGIDALLEGKTSLAGASRSLKAEEKKKNLLGHTIGYDAIAVFVHKNNPVKNLSKEQLRGIFTGRIKNWKEVGGKNAPIAPNTEISGGKRATMEMFQELVMDKAPYGKGFKEIDYPRDQIKEVARDENGICSVSLGLLTALSEAERAQVKALKVGDIEPTENNVKSGAYLVSRPLLLVTKGLPKGAVKEFINFMLSKEGQAIVAKHFVPVRR